MKGKGEGETSREVRQGEREKDRGSGREGERLKWRNRGDRREMEGKRGEEIPEKWKVRERKKREQKRREMRDESGR